MNVIDLRSDTITKPTQAMRDAMANAVVGDDVYGEDKTVNQLQEMAAEITGKQAGLYVPSGTMGNLAAILAHCNRGDEIILGNQAHTYLNEAGGIAALGGVHSFAIPNQADGTLDLDNIIDAIRDSSDAHHPITRLITLENTHNGCGGVPLSEAYTQAVGELAKKHGLKVHLDGARLFNAAVALGVEPRALTEPLDSVTFCLSKALCAPVGSVICGSKEFIARAHRIRKQLGGGMRQAGIVAAAGIVALEQMVEQLAEDHRRAKELIIGLAKIPGILVDPEGQHTNMVYFELNPEVQISTETFVVELARRGLKIGEVGKRRFRLVTHHWFSDEDLATALQLIGEILSQK
ncbi:MAG: low-specificity L-threonine aldolase [Chloroflexi bacterium]|nr:low-specificity L-threonine aldolase [Chloroflexota bacterium]